MHYDISKNNFIFPLPKLFICIIFAPSLESHVRNR